MLAAALCVAMNPLAGQPRPEQLRVVSYNVHHGAGNDVCDGKPDTGADCGLDLERISRVIESHRPDVVALQEVDRFWKRSGGTDQVAEFAALLGMHSCYGANLQLPPEVANAPAKEYGTLILSRHPIAECTNTLLPKASEDAEQRGLLQAVIRIGEREVAIWNTHLHVRAEDRLLQTAHLAERHRLQFGSKATDRPLVLMGDLNARPDAAELAPLLALFDDAGKVGGGGGGLNSTAQPGEPPRNRIDYILVSHGITVNSIAVDTSPAAVMASDHYPVAAELSLPSR